MFDSPGGFLKRLGYLWYLVNPKEHMYSKVEDVPDYYTEAIPAYVFMIIVEQTVCLIKGRRMMRLNDSVTNISQGVLMELFKIPIHGVELVVYTWVYNNWRVVTLPWNSLTIWIFCLVISDFCYYWMHRAIHQISFLWAFHEIHHSSEDYNLTVPLRLHIFHNASLWLTYIPLAFAIPPSVYLVHYQLNVIFQFWLHTEAVTTLGIVEYVFVTPSHHRVHHGRNRRCIDRNFGSVFIIWDHIFGTFEPEGKEKIHFGITKPLQTFNPIIVQFNHFLEIFDRLRKSDSFVNKLFYIIKGPGWSPGKPWMGNIEDIPEPTEKARKYNPPLSRSLQLYVFFHTVALVTGHLKIMLNLAVMSKFAFVICSSYIVFTTFALSCILDLRQGTYLIELFRCFCYCVFDTILQNTFPNVWNDVIMSSFRFLFFTSFTFWLFALPFLYYGYLKKLLKCIEM